jgi:hypothetical protein
MQRRVDYGLWLVWLLLAVFAGEWVLLWAVMQSVPHDQLLWWVFGVIMATILVAWIAVYVRMQRKRP